MKRRPRSFPFLSAIAMIACGFSPPEATAVELPNNPFLMDAAPTTTTAPALRRRAAIVDRVFGQARVRFSETSDWMPCREKMEVPEGAEFETGSRESRVELHFEGETIRVYRLTKVKLLRLSEDETGV